MSSLQETGQFPHQARYRRPILTVLSLQDHIPKTCAEAAAEDEHLNSRHTIEEAMTQVSVDGSI
jgi:hypothetical protein